MLSHERSTEEGKLGVVWVSGTQAPVPLLHHPEGVAFFIKVSAWAEMADRVPAIICRTGLQEGKGKVRAKGHLSK